MKLRWANPHARQDDRECGVLLYTNVECGTVAMSNLDRCVMLLPGSWQHQINLQIKHQIYQSKHLELRHGQ